MRTTDPPRTADEQFLLSQAIDQAVEQLVLNNVTDRLIFVDPTYLIGGNLPSQEQSYLLGEVRNRLLIAGARLAEQREASDIILEVRSGAIGINRLEYLLGVPSLAVPGALTADVPVAVPELAIVKNRRQFGFASVSVTAYFRETGELVASSGPFVGETYRTDYWFFGIGPTTRGDIPPARR